VEKIVKKLDAINKTLQDIQQTPNRPENKIMTIFEIAGAGVSALGFLSTVDIIRRWIMGV